MGEETNKSFTDKRLSVDLLLMIVLVLSIFFGWSIVNLTARVNFLEDHDIEMQTLKQQLFIDVLKGK